MAPGVGDLRTLLAVVRMGPVFPYWLSLPGALWPKPWPGLCAGGFCHPNPFFCFAKRFLERTEADEHTGKSLKGNNPRTTRFFQEGGKPISFWLSPHQSIWSPRPCFGIEGFSSPSVKSVLDAWGKDHLHLTPRSATKPPWLAILGLIHLLNVYFLADT